jgi:hypothetical protein
MGKYTSRGLALSLVIATHAFASVDTIGPNGINSAGLTTANGLPLNGGAVGTVPAVAIGQVEIDRPGDPSFDNDPTLFHTAVDPAQVFFLRQGPPTTFNATVNSTIEIAGKAPPLTPSDGQHAIEVAGVMISTATATPPTPQTPTGVATGARLYSTGVASAPDINQWDAINMQHLATLAGIDIRAINFSVLVSLPSGEDTDGNSLITQFVDWSSHEHDVLYVLAGTELGPPATFVLPTDNFNGITVAASRQVGGAGSYDSVSLVNTFSSDAAGDRTSISLLAPGDPVDVTGRNSQTLVDSGTSFAAPHVTGTVALLQQYANERIVNSDWNAVNSRRHETMKAVLLNSADKIIDNGTFTIPGDTQPAAAGTFLGMERTVTDQQGMHWLQSEAYGDTPFSDESFIPLDDQMGAGHLNAKRAVQQFAPGEHDSDGAPVPVIGWDYGHTSGAGDDNKYVISQPLRGGSFISVTMAWDRGVTLNDTNSNGLFDFGEEFEPYTSFPPIPHADDVINDLDLYLVPAGMTIDDAIATSLSNDSTIDHLFFRIPTTGQYEIWVNQFDADLGNGQDYAIAWWAAAAIGVAQGDYNGDQVVDAQDYTAWKSGFGSTVTVGTGADGNGNGFIDAGNYVVWRNALSAGSGSLATVPEPHHFWLVLSAVLMDAGVSRRRTAFGGKVGAFGGSQSKSS